jgi:hypothetical protein
VSAEKVGSVGPQSTDPPWVRLLFTVLEGRDGQIWRAVLLMTPPLLLVAGLVIVVTGAPVGWIIGALGGGSLTTSAFALFKRRQRHHRTELRDS